MFPRFQWPFSFPSVSVVLGLFALGVMTDTASAQPVYIEEDWEVIIGTPDPDGHAPQIITAMSSTDRLEDVHAIFEINHSTLPNYQAGGMALQIWSSGTNLAYMVHPQQGTLHHQDEVITYKMTMRVSNGVIKFEIKDGDSTTWGTNWGIGGFERQVSTSQTALVNYSPLTSVKFSKVAFAKHRVKKFALKESRTYGPNGVLLTRDTTERIVHQLTEDGI